MLVGAALSRYMTPETCDKDGRSRKLEDLGEGKKSRRMLDSEENEDVKGVRSR